MPAYPIKRIPLRPSNNGRCVFCDTDLETDETWPWLKLCPYCDCMCRYRKEDLYFNDGLVFPCSDHDADLPPYEEWPECQ